MDYDYQMYSFLQQLFLANLENLILQSQEAHIEHFQGYYLNSTSSSIFHWRYYLVILWKMDQFLAIGKMQK